MPLLKNDFSTILQDIFNNPQNYPQQPSKVVLEDNLKKTISQR